MTQVARRQQQWFGQLEKRQVKTRVQSRERRREPEMAHVQGDIPSYVVVISALLFIQTAFLLSLTVYSPPGFDQ